MISAKGLSKAFGKGEDKTYVLKDINLEVQAGEFVAVLGGVGAGKTTLIRLLSTLDMPTEGVVEYDGVNIATLKGRHLTRFRKDTLGFMFQEAHLMPVLTVYENLEVAVRPIMNNKKERESTIYEMIAKVGLTGKEDKVPAELSRYEKQRVALGRALVKKPKVLFCDEPTEFLGEEAGERILHLIHDLTSEITVFFSTRFKNPLIPQWADRIITLKNGMMVT
jgi:ABC-type lipoprotein export system ATPase subunit